MQSTYSSATGQMKRTNLRSQQLVVVDGLMKVKYPDTSIIDKQLEETQKRLEALELDASKKGLNTEKIYLPTYKEAPAPVEVVLRFYAYFQESITESQEETSRYRFVRIYVYAEDDTIMIEEEKFRNAGITQGVLLNRMRLSNPTAPFGTMYDENDFNVGIDIDLSGIVYHVYGCDDFTRDFLINSLHKDVPENEKPPKDLYTLKRKLTERPIRVTNINTDKTNLKSFLEYDGKVLRFYCIWDDTNNLFGERRKFILHYFLVDGTIEIRQVLTQNSGRVPVSLFLRRVVLSKPEGGSNYTEADLRLGATVNVYGRLFFIYDADPFTRQFIDEKYGPQDWTPIDIGQSTQVAVTEEQTPPYNGWGDEEDSLGFCHSLHPQPPRKNSIQMLDKMGEILRFAASFVNPSPIDVGREFVIAYYLADDGVAVFEKPRRNSGFREGKFIQKSRIKNPMTGTYFKPSDFFVGATVIINAYKFHITQADEYALNTMEANSDDFPKSDLMVIINKIRSDQKKVQRLRQEFERDDPELDGFLPDDIVTEKLLSVTGLTQQEALTVVRRWCDDKKGFDYFSFMSCLA